MKKSIAGLLFCLFVLSACQHKSKNSDKNAQTEIVDSVAIQIGKHIEEAYNDSEFKAAHAISFQMEVNYRNLTAFRPNVNMNTDFKYLDLVRKDGRTLTFENGEISKTGNMDMTLLTWINLFTLPYQLPQNVLTHGQKNVEDCQNEPCASFQLTLKNLFYNNSKELKIYVNDLTGFITEIDFLKNSEKPFRDVDFIRFEQYFTSGHVPIAKKWLLYKRRRNEAPQLVGDVILSKVKFTDK